MLDSPTSPSSHLAQTVDLTTPSAFDFSASEKHDERVGNKGIESTLYVPFAEFARQELLINPFEDEIRRDNDFQGQLHQQLLDLILEFHAWSTSRPDSESASAGEALLEETRAIQKLEEEQGMWSILFEQSRLRLAEFIMRMKAALATLTAFSL